VIDDLKEKKCRNGEKLSNNVAPPELGVF